MQSTIINYPKHRTYQEFKDIAVEMATVISQITHSKDMGSLVKRMERLNALRYFVYEIEDGCFRMNQILKGKVDALVLFVDSKKQL